MEPPCMKKGFWCINLDEEAPEEVDERFLSHGISELASAPIIELLVFMMKDEAAGLAKDEEAGLGLYDALGLCWFEEYGLAEVEPPTISIRSTGGLLPFRENFENHL